MQTLNLYKNRRHKIIILGDKREYKIPAEYTVEEVERLMELKQIQEEIEKEEVVENLKEDQQRKLWDNVFDQIEMLFQHFQPEITADDLKKIITHNEALEMIGFFDKYRHSNSKGSNSDVKKKLN